MALVEQMRKDLVLSQKAGKADLTLLIRFLLSALHNREIEKRSQGKEETLSDDEVVEVLRREEKRRKEAVELMRKGGREDLARSEEEQLALLAPYLPAPMSREEIFSVVEKLHRGGIADTNMLMREAMKELKGKAGGNEVKAIVEELCG